MTRHTVDDIDALVDNFHEHRKRMADAGKIDDFGHPVAPPKPAKVKPEPHTHKSWCLKCKKMSDSLTKEVKPNERGTHEVSGKCKACGTSTHKFVGKEEGVKMLGEMATTGGQA